MSPRDLLRRASSRLRALLLRTPRLFVLLWSPDDRELGLLGEEIAARHLARHGWRILARRLRTRAGEADLVARRGEQVVVFEVKTGRSACVPRPRGAEIDAGLLLRWRPGARCGARKLARLHEIGGEIDRDASPAHPGYAARARPRVDLMEVFLEAPRRRFRVRHHEDLSAPLPRRPGARGRGA